MIIAQEVLDHKPKRITKPVQELTYNTKIQTNSKLSPTITNPIKQHATHYKNETKGQRMKSSSKTNQKSSHYFTSSKHLCTCRKMQASMKDVSSEFLYTQGISAASYNFTTWDLAPRHQKQFEYKDAEPHPTQNQRAKAL
ncbi:hypothetical protein QL285_072353 [Trifolium repens]|jgi:hypothetical protein|nr:hypothetical protein QL285_072353 [Trifolium repens]